MSCQPDMDTEIIGLSQAVPVVLRQGTEGGRYGVEEFIQRKSILRRFE